QDASKLLRIALFLRAERYLDVAAGKAGALLVREPIRQVGLSDAGHSLQGHNGDRLRRPRLREQCLLKRIQLLGAPHEDVLHSPVHLRPGRNAGSGPQVHAVGRFAISAVIVMPMAAARRPGAVTDANATRPPERARRTVRPAFVEGDIDALAGV